MKLKRPLPKGAVLGGIVAAGLVVGLLGWLVVIAPMNHKATRLDAQTAQVEQQIGQNLAAITASKTAVVAPKIRVADLYKLAQAMPTAPDIPDLLIEVNQVTQDAGVTLTTLDAPTVDPTTGKITIDLSVGGDFYTVTDLLYRLRNLVSVRDGALDVRGRLFSIDSVALAPGSTGHGLTASLTLHAFDYVPPAPAPVPIAPPAASTTTTSTDSSGGPSAAGAP